MTYRKKLIEVALPLEDINREAAREKSIRHGHPSTLHLWWARRPLAACRAVLFASLVDDPSECLPELLADTGKRETAEGELRKRQELRKDACALLDKARAAGTSAPDPGLEPKLAAIIVENERERLFGIIRELVKWENSNNERVLDAARAEIMRSCNGNPPPVYDPFCGGGSIPLEAQRLGLEAHASDLNPVPVLINKALIEIPPRFANKPPVNPESLQKFGSSGSWKGSAGLAEDIRYYGKWMCGNALESIGQLYPEVAVMQEKDGSFRHATESERAEWEQEKNRKKFDPDLQGKSRVNGLTVIAWLWVRTVATPNPAAKGAHVPLTRSFCLSKKPGNKAWVEPVVDQSTMTYQFEVRTGDGKPPEGTVGRNGGVCLLTGSPIPLDYIRAEGKAGRLGARLMAIVAEGRTGRIFFAPTEEHERVALAAKPENVPETDLPEEALGFRVQNYGITMHRLLFSNRQLVALTTFCDLVDGARTEAYKDAAGAGWKIFDAQAYADAVATYCAFAVSKAADLASTICHWQPNPQHLKIAPTFSRHALAFSWDFAEGNPFSGSSGNFFRQWELISKVVSELAVSRSGTAKQLDARTAVSEGRQPLFSTDPPYYDNIPYADLSDFFYIWLRRCLQTIYPELLRTVLVPKGLELVADPFRHGGKDKAMLFFERGIGEVFQAMRGTSDPRFPTTIYYAFKQTEDEEESDEDGDEGNTSRASTGWETFLQGLFDAGWQIDGTWPMRTERPGRQRESGSNALASSIVLVCRPRPKDAGVTSRRDFLAALKRELPEALRNLQKGNIAPVDLAQAAIGPGIAVFSRYAKVLETNGTPMSVRTALSLINQSLDEVLAEQEGEFDSDTRWALAWFDQNGFNEGPYGVAETLCTAKNTSVAGMVDAGFLAAKGGKVRLLRRDELPANWDPVKDKRLTIWECTHQLIRALDAGEGKAADLLKKVGSHAEAARDLSYRLYSICERRKWAQDALGYNALVLAWGDVRRMADENRTGQHLVDGELNLES